MKRLILILSFVILSGCTANYDIEFTDGEINESFIVTTNTSEMCGNDLCMNYINAYAENNISTNYYNDTVNEKFYYNKNIINENGRYELRLDYNYVETTHYSSSFLANNLFKNVIVNDNKFVAYDIKNIFNNYLYLDEIVVSFSTDKVISSSNSDKIIDSKYYWFINRDNYQSKSISVYFDEEQSKIENKEYIEDGYITWNFIKYILYILVLVVIVGIVYIYIRFKKSSR